MLTGRGSDAGSVVTLAAQGLCYRYYTLGTALGEHTMVTITLAREWVDGNGVQHPQGGQIEIPESELDDMVAEGYVSIGGGDEGEDGMHWS